MKKPARAKAPWTSAFPEQMPPAITAVSLLRKATAAKALRKTKRDRLREYRDAARDFVAQKRGQLCPVAGCELGLKRAVVEVHHMRGRRGALLMDSRHWLAVSRIGHRWIHDNVAEARRYGWIAPAGKWGKP